MEVKLPFSPVKWAFCTCWSPLDHGYLYRLLQARELNYELLLAPVVLWLGRVSDYGELNKLWLLGDINTTATRCCLRLLVEASQCLFELG